MSITTFAELITTPGTQKVFLVEIDPSQRITDWTLHAGSVYKKQIGTIHVRSVTEDNSALTEVSSLDDMGAGKWHYDGDYLYVQSTSGTPYQNIMVANYRMYLGNYPKTFSDRFYDPFVKGIPTIRQKKADLYWGISVANSGNVTLHNDKGFFDDIYESYAWNNRAIKVLAGGEDLPYSQYATMFEGLISSKAMTTSVVTLAFEDRNKIFEATLPLNAFGKTDYPNLEDEDVGKPVPYIWGTVLRMPVICTNRALGTATNTFNFKIGDTSTHSVQALDAVYVNGNIVAQTSTSLPAATFNLHSGLYTPGDEVTVDVDGFQSGTTLIENPIDVTEEIAVLLGVEDADWDTTARAAARTEAADYVIGLAVYEFGQAINIVSEIMRSCMGTFKPNNEGKHSVSIWNADMPEDPEAISEIEVKDFKTVSRVDLIRKTIRIGWAKNWARNTYAYRIQSSEETEPLHGITRSRTIPTLLSSSTGAEKYIARMLLLYENATVMVSFKHKLLLALKNIGDRFSLSFRRRAADPHFEWLESRIVEIQEIKKDFTKAEIAVVASDMKEIGQKIGKWTADVLTFPIGIGGGTATEWDDDWSESEKAFARQNWGFWCDEDDFADAEKREYNISRFW